MQFLNYFTPTLHEEIYHNNFGIAEYVHSNVKFCLYRSAMGIRKNLNLSENVHTMRPCKSGPPNFYLSKLTPMQF